jgi:UbiD family decarboxylase
MGFMDMRQWMGLLEKEGELRRIGAQVHWDRELGAIARRVLEKKGPALVFDNVTGYERAGSAIVGGWRCRWAFPRTWGTPSWCSTS